MLLSAGSIRCTYDASGRTVARHKARLSREPDVWQYSWDAEDRLIACRTPDGALWQYSYDPLGRHPVKDQVDEGGAVVHSVHFTWDGTTLVEQTDTAQHTTLTCDYDGTRHSASSNAVRDSLRLHRHPLRRTRGSSLSSPT